MNMNVDYKNKFNSILLKVFSYTIDFLERNNLQYWVGQGTAIGAVRHHGMIPWDDDIDIYLKRDDYNKLLSLREEIKKEGYRITSGLDKGNPVPFAKIYDPDTTLWEDKNYPFIIGVYVDVYPLDQLDTDKTRAMDLYYKDKALLGRYQRSLYTCSINELSSLLFHGRLLTFMFALKNLICYKPFSKHYYKKFIQFDNSINEGKGHLLLSIGGGFGERELYPSSWFDESIEMPFESFSVKVPSGYDAYLTQMYGDYMTPPPVEKRVLKHGQLRYYINLKEGLSLGEVKNRIKQGETLVY